MTTAHEYEKFSENYFKYARRTRDSLLIGDWNILLNENMCNREVSALHKQKTRLLGHYFSDWIDIHGIIDTDLKYTFSRGQYRARLDRIYMKEETMLNTKEYDIKSAAISDHEQITIKMRWGNRPVWGRGCWKLNNELLKQDKFKDEVQQIIQVYRANKGYFDPKHRMGRAKT